MFMRRGANWLNHSGISSLQRNALFDLGLIPRNLARDNLEFA